MEGKHNPTIHFASYEYVKLCQLEKLLSKIRGLRLPKAARELVTEADGILNDLIPREERQHCSQYKLSELSGKERVE